MINLQLSNKKTQYSAKSESINLRIEGTVTVDESLKVVGFSGQIYSKVSVGMNIGSFSYNENASSANMQQSKDFIAEASQLVIDTVKGIETELINA